MPDIVELLIDGQKYDRWLSYRIDADLYQSSDTFSLDVAGYDTSVKPGMRCVLRVNGAVELTGIIDQVRKSGDKSGDRITLEGRDLLGLLTDTYCEKFISVEGKTIKQLAELLLADLPFIKRSEIIYQENVKGKLKGKKQTASTPEAAFLDTPQKISQIEPGMTVFEVLATYAASRGLLFFALPDGTLVFGRPHSAGNGPPLFRLIRRQGETNIISYDETTDYSRRWSQITVVSQQQASPPNLNDQAAMAAYISATSAQKHTNATYTLKDSAFPYYKPLVVKMTSDSQTPPLHARMLYEKQLHDSYRLEYTVPGHSQDGENWRINELAKVTDDRLGVNGVFLIFARTFSRSRGEGSTTRLRLGPPGLVAAP